MISKFSVKKPYTVLVGVLLVIVLGVVSLTRMTTDLLPNMSLQYALIITTDMGASPEKVEMEVTAPIESAIATTTGIKNVGSMSYNSYSIVTCEYDDSVNMDSVVIEIQQSLDQLSGYWGDNVGTPMIMQINPDMLPVMTAAVDVEGMSALEITEYVDTELIPAFESLEGVASASASGMLEETVMVTLDPIKIQAINDLVQKEISGEFVKPQAEINDAISEIKKGKDAMGEGGNAISEVFDEVMAGKKQLLEAESELSKQYTTLVEQRGELKQLSNIVIPILELRDQSIQALEKAQKELPELEQKMKTLEAALAKQTGESAQVLEQLNSEKAELEAAAEQAKTTYGEESEEYQTAQAAVNAKNQEIAAETAKAAELQVQYEAAKVSYEAAKAVVDAGESAWAALDAQLLEYAKDLNSTGMMEIKSSEDIDKIKPALEEALKIMDDGVAQMEEAMSMIESQKNEIQGAIDTLNTEAAKAAMEVGTAAAELSVAGAALEEAKTSLESAKEEALNAADIEGILTIETLSGLIVAQNFDMPAGYAYEDDTQYLIRVGESVKSVEELEDLVLMDMGMESVGLIRLSDVANIEIVDNSDETYAIVNGNPSVTLSFEKQTGYSTGEVTDRLLEKFESLEKQDEKLNITVLMDQGIYIDLIVDSVMQNMIIGAILAVLVLIVFLKDYRPTIVIALSIPLSVITAIVLMYFMDISLNIISLSGLMLGVGMLVDNSIVVIENIYRLRSEGMSIRKACVEGSNQVAGAIVASTLTTVSVYIPIIFTEGMTRQLFVDLALTVAFTLTASLVVALTVVPAMSSFTLKKTKETKTPWFDKMQNWYGGILEKCLKHKALIFVLSIVLLIASAAISLSQGLTFMDMDMETNQLTVTVAAREGERFTFTELTDMSNQVIDKIADIEGIDTIGASAGGSSTSSLLGGGSESVTMYILLDENADVTTKQISAEIEERTKDLNCEVTSSSSSMDMTAMFGSGLSLQIKGSDLDTLQELAAEAAKILEETEGTVDVEDGLDETTPQWTINVDKEKAAEYGMTVAQVYQLVMAEMVSSSSTTTISTDIKDYKVYLQTEEQSELVLDDIKALTFTYTDKKGEETEILLTDICTMEETTTLSTIYRDSQSRYITVSCGIDDEHNVTLVSNEVQEKMDAMNIPEGYEIEMAGEDETINEAMEQMVLMLILAVIFIYLIMVAQFQSLLLPFIIMFTIPLAFTGGFIALFLSGKEVSIIAMLGFIMLAGVIVNNGIVLIEYITQARQEGKLKKEAIIEAGVIRLRPILMTALTTILAMVPSCMGLGDGSEMMQPMSITMVGGLIYGTLLTLIVIPCIYDVFTKEKNMVEEEL
ncbi:MAG: efflux RND transporter permease subunit [Lachnospiraceae bacterium]|nr:efflux RND transporter permease subunit [Lachnospiraceae bacterium]